jgi:hypothetical protein
MLSTTLRKARLPLWAAAFFALLVPTASQAANNPLLIDAANTGANSTRLTGNFNGHLFSATDSNVGAQAVGVTGVHSASTGTGGGVLGYTASHTAGAVGVYGYETSTTAAAGSAGVIGRTDSTVGGFDFPGTGVAGVLGIVNPTSPGYWSAAVRGVNNGTGAAGLGVWGSQNGSGWGVYGSTDSGVGVAGTSVHPCNNSSSAAGVMGKYANYKNYGELGTCAFGVAGYSFQGIGGVGVYGTAQNGGEAGAFDGTVEIRGELKVTGGCTGCSAPSGAAAGAPNVQSGNVVTDRRGDAVVHVVGMTGRDLRYQLTVVGRSFARAIVWRELRGGTFTIRTDRPHVKVSWQVTRPVT